jgi:cyanophycin synthetase
MTEPDQLKYIVRTQVDVVLPEGVAVLNGADESVVELAELCKGEVMYFGLDEHTPAIAAHLAQGKRAVCVNDGWIVLAEAQTRTRLLRADAVAPDARTPPVARSLEQTLAAVGAGWALGLPLAALRAGLETQGSPHPALVVAKR